MLGREFAKLLLACFLIVSPGLTQPAYAQRDDTRDRESAAHSTSSTNIGRPDTLYFRFDNDMFARPPSDTNYTMGVSLKLTTFRDSMDAFPPFRVLDVVWDHWLVPSLESSSNSAPPKRSRTLEVADDAFTPQCLHSAPTCAAEGHPIDRDRPYANIFWIGVQYDQHDKDSGNGRRAEFDIGVLGTSIGRVVQTWIHEKCCTSKIPQEWNTQIGEGGAPTFLVKQINRSRIKKYGDFELSARYGFWAGWYTWPTVGVVASFGRVLRLESDASYVLYDQLLQGAWAGKNTITYKHSEIEPIVTLFHMNLDLINLFCLLTCERKESNWSLSYTQHWKSRDLKVPGVESRHRWGGVEFSYRF